MKGKSRQIDNRPQQSQLRDIEDLGESAHRLGVTVDAIEDVSILAEPVEAGDLRLPNSLAVHPMEAADGDAQGRPGELTLRRYERYVAGGAGLIWVEATAVVPEARAYPRQLWINSLSKGAFAALVRIMRRAASESMGPGHKPVLVLQLTHSGRYSGPGGVVQPLIARRDPYRDALSPQREPDPNAPSKIPQDQPVLTDDCLDKLVDDYVIAAAMAFEVGFDAVDIKSCHGYLISELLSCHGRAGRYGGSFENRTRFLLDVIDRIGSELGSDKAVVTRLGVYDAVPYRFGWGVDRHDYTKPDLSEPKKLIRCLIQRGVKMINVTVADPHYNPHYGRPFNEPIAGGYQSPEHPLLGVARLVGLAAEIQSEFRNIAVVGTGYSWLGTLMANAAAAAKSKGLAAVIGVGRMALAYPDFAKDIILKGRLDPRKVCIACSKCSQMMVNGATIGCAVRDSRIYGPIYQLCRKKQTDGG